MIVKDRELSTNGQQLGDSVACHGEGAELRCELSSVGSKAVVLTTDCRAALSVVKPSV